MHYTAESVSRAHPDKVCDQIADAILDACLAEDAGSRVAIEAMGGHGHLFITGELTTRAAMDEQRMAGIARSVYRDCGYTDELSVTGAVSQQSPEIGRGVDADGAGDQGVMIGYATAETASLMPAEMELARSLVRQMQDRDGKAQVTLRDGVLDTCITSLCRDRDIPEAAIKLAVHEQLTPYLPAGSAVADHWVRDPSGEWTISGFTADAGLTGRKIAVDSYGPRVPVGGGAFAGKDPTKVDRSGACMARKIAVDYVQRGAREVLVTLAYGIAMPEPVEATAVVDGTEEQVRGHDLRPRAIIERLSLDQPGYYQAAQYGHFGRGFIWDRADT